MPLSQFPSGLRSVTKAGRAALVLSLGVAIAGCGGIAQNQSLNSIHQPVVDHTTYSLDVNTGADGLAPGEQKRIVEWFSAMDLRYGDRIALDDPLSSDATRAAVEVVLSHYGLLLSHEAPVTPGYVNAGTARIVIIRASAYVPHCPDWGDNAEANPKNGTSRNYGCAVNSNLAAMVANPDDLLKGAPSTGVSSVARNDKAINAYYATAASGAGGQLKNDSTKSGN